ncbi:MAG: NAD(P)H-binding protein [Acidobacteriaceae bacterium]|nr:NAD(P)H-binding protein [Acidobacteriaceae bacterium]
MKVAIFGASGSTGRLLTERSLVAGYEVSALVRRPEVFAQREQVRVVAGSAFDPVAVRQTIDGADVVLSALGARSWRREDVLERAVPLIVAAMRETRVRRIIALGSAGAREDSMKKQSAVQRWIVHHIVYKTILKWPVASQIAQWETLSASGLDWTMVMPPMLTNGPGRGCRVDGEALPPGASRISRTDVAEFMMRQIGSSEWVGKGVYIAW